MKDKVVQNNSQVRFKKTEVEDHHRIFSISNKTKSVTACNDSLKSRTSNVNVVCVTCGKCMFNLNHDACVSKFISDVNARSNKPQEVPIRPRKPIRKANQSVATTPNKTIVQLILFIVDSGCIKHMTGNLKLLCNFVEKYMGTVQFEKDQFAPILGYEDLVQGNITIKRVYYVEGLNHNLFSVDQFCDADLEVAFRKSTCFVSDLQGNDLLTGNHGSDLYTIYLQQTSTPTPIYFMAKASPTQAWLWHQRLSHLNFDTINLLSKTKAKRSTFKTKTVPSSKGRLNLLHMDLCGPVRIESINGKKYILENNNDQAADAHIDENEFYNIFSTPTKDHPLEEVRRNPSKLVQTRRQLATDPEMCMFPLTVSTPEPKNIKEAMADSAWIEAMQDELHQFDRLQVWELVDKPFGKKEEGIDFEESFAPVARLEAVRLFAFALLALPDQRQNLFSILQDGRKNDRFLMSHIKRVC
ncbi:retrovirus-related pol polyprotein from transposon TNT 1-94 [Tanacetum coccineum]